MCEEERVIGEQGSGSADSRRDAEITEKSELLEDFIHTKYGYCYYEVEEGRVPIIYNLYVHPEYRRTGQAKKLLAYVIDQIRSLGYTGKIDIEALPREQSISREDLANFYEGMGLRVIENSPVNELAAEVEHLRLVIAKLSGQKWRLIEVGNKTYRKFVGWFDVREWLDVVKEITGEKL